MLFGSMVFWVLALRALKLLAVAAFAAGSLGATFPMAMPLATRRRLAATLAGPGFGLTWLLGFVLAGLTARSLLSGWILGSLALSLVGLQAVLYAVGKEGRAGPGRAGAFLVAALTFVGCVLLMVTKL